MIPFGVIYFQLAYHTNANPTDTKIYLPCNIYMDWFIRLVSLNINWSVKHFLKVLEETITWNVSKQLFLIYLHIYRNKVFAISIWKCYFLPFPYESENFIKKFLSPFVTKVPLKDKPGYSFLPSKCFKSTCGRVKFCY